MSRSTLSALKELLEKSPFQSVLGVSVAFVDDGETRLELSVTLRPELERFATSRQYHGGVIASLIDIAGDFALIHELGYAVPTINFRVDYLRPAYETDLRARPVIRRTGRSVGIVDIDVLDDEDVVIAIGRGAYSTKKG